MANLAQSVERKAFSVAIDAALKHLNKDREKGLLQIVDLAEKFMGDNFRKEAYDGARKMIQDPDNKWMHYVNRLLDETDPHVAKMTALNLGYQAAFVGTKTIRKMREVHNCNIPWLILMDPTSACNLRCTGCWAAEYGHKLNLTFDELDNIVTQGKELGIYFYMMTGGEPLVRKDDIIKLCEKHNECAFHCYTNGTLVDQAFCDEMKRVGNLSLSISLEGFEEANDFRRGEGVFDKVLHFLCKQEVCQNKLLFRLEAYSAESAPVSQRSACFQQFEIGVAHQNFLPQLAADKLRLDFTVHARMAHFFQLRTDVVRHIRHTDQIRLVSIDQNVSQLIPLHAEIHQ